MVRASTKKLCVSASHFESCLHLKHLQRSSASTHVKAVVRAMVRVGWGLLQKEELIEKQSY